MKKLELPPGVFGFKIPWQVLSNMVKFVYTSIKKQVFVLFIMDKLSYGSVDQSEGILSLPARKINNFGLF